MSEDLVDIVMNIHNFNQDLTSLNIKQQEEIEKLKGVYKNNLELVDKMYVKDKEIERLNNIINELEIYINKTIIDGGTRGGMTFWYRQIYDYLQELKEVIKSE